MSSAFERTLSRSSLLEKVLLHYTGFKDAACKKTFVEDKGNRVAKKRSGKIDVAISLPGHSEVLLSQSSWCYRTLGHVRQLSICSSTSSW